MSSQFKEKNSLKAFLGKSQIFLELLVLTFTYFWVWKFFYRGTSFPYYGRGKFILAGIYALLVIVLFVLNESARFGYLKLTETIISQCISILIADTITYFQLCLIANVMVDFFPIFFLTVVDFVICAIFTCLFTSLNLSASSPKKLIMVYGSPQALDLKFKMDQRSEKYNIAAVIGSSEGLEAIFNKISGYDGVVINDVESGIRNDILKYCYEKSLEAYLVPKISDVILRGAQEITLFDTPLVYVRSQGLSSSEAFLKRALDLTLCLIALIPGSLIMLFTSLAIKLEDGGPVFYRQKRLTKDGRTFDILKFRSMVTDAEDPEKYKDFRATDNDPRITRVGRFIRKTRLDELPQIFNIIKNDMSIVGPRPERIEQAMEYEAEISEFKYRTKVKGGLTGYAQIYGKYNTSAYDKLRLDLKYIEDYSFLLDIKLILMTLQIMLRSESTEGFNKTKELEEKRNELLKGSSEE